MWATKITPQTYGLSGRDTDMISRWRHSLNHVYWARGRLDRSTRSRVATYLLQSQRNLQLANLSLAMVLAPG